jgi:hypothetical protein
MEGLGFNMDMTRRLTGQPVTPETSQPATAVPNAFEALGMQSFSEANPDLVGMPTEQELMGALRNAHNAGDTAAAQRFAGMIEKVRNPNDYSLMAQGFDNIQSGMMRIGEGALRAPQVLTDAAFQAMGKDVSQGYDGTGEDILNYFNSMADAVAEKNKDVNYVSATSWQEVKDNPTAENILGFMGEATLGSLPDMAAALISAPAYFATYIAPISQERAKNNGRDIPTPSDVAAAMVSSAGIAAAERFGAKGIFGGVSGNIATRPIKAGVRESATEAIQSPLEYAGQTLGTDTGFDPATALDQAAAGAVGGFGAGTGIRGTIDVANAIGDPSSIGNPANQPDDAQAAADFARDLETIAQEEGLDLKDVSKTSTGGSRQALDLQHVRYDGDMQRLRNVLKEQLGKKDTDPEIVQIDKMLAQLAYREARTKTKNIVGQREFAAVERLVGNTKEGSELINVMRKTNELTKLHNAGFQGGVSQFTDQLMPFGVGIGYDRGAQNAERLLRPLISGGIATNTYGLSLLGQTAAVGAGRAIDAVTGNRSIVNKYVNKNRKGEGMTSLTEPSMLEQARALEASNVLETALSNQREQDRRQRAFIAGDLPRLDSPEQLMNSKTGGVPTEVIMEIVRDIADADPALAVPAREFIDSITGRLPVDQEVEGLPALMQRVATIVENNPEYSKLRNPEQAARLSENYSITVPAAQGSTPTGVAPAPRDVSAGYVRGIEANREAADRLADEVSIDTSISPRDKVVLLNALEDLRGNLGLDPVNRAQEIGVDAERSLSDPALADKYLMPYINRVAEQQELQSDEMAAPEIGQGAKVDIMTRKRYEKQFNIKVKQGNFAIGKEDVTNNNYTGARIYVTPQGFPALEVDTSISEEAPSKSMGKRFHTNAVRPDKFDWVQNPTGATGFLTAIDTGDGHFYAMDIQLDVPTEMFRKSLNADGTEKDNPTLRPRGFGVVELGAPIGVINYKSSKKQHPVYGKVVVSNARDINAPQFDEFTDIRLPQGEKPEKKKPHREIGEILMAEQARRYNRDLDPYNDEGDFNRVAEALTDEGRFQLERNPDSADWYDEDIEKALDLTAEIIPSVKTDPNAKRMFLLLAALTSIGHKPRINWRYAGALMMHYENTGRIGEIGSVFSEKRQTSEQRTVNPVTGKVFGLKAAAVEPPLNIFNHLINKYGVDGAFDWLHSPKTKAEIDAIRAEAGYGKQAKIKGGKDTVVEGLMIFGQKVSPFYKNLNGIRDVTVDVWASRSIRRHTGGLLLPNYDINNRKAAETGLVDAPTAKELPVMKRLYEQVGSNLGISPQAAQAILWEYEQQLYNDLGAKNETERFSEGAELFKQKEAQDYYVRHPEYASGQSGSRQVETEFQVDEYNESAFPQEQANSGQSVTPPAISSRPPTDQEMRDQLEAIERGDIATIGKKGTLFEQGLNSEAAVESLAAAFNIGIQMITSSMGGQKIINKDFGGSKSTKKRLKGAGSAIGVYISGGALDAYDPSTPGSMPRPYMDSPSRGRAYIREDLVKENFGAQERIARLYVKAHEALGHVIEQAILDYRKSYSHPLTGSREVKTEPFEYNQGVLIDILDPKAAMSDMAQRGDVGKYAGYSNTLRGEMQILLDALSGLPQTDRGKVLAANKEAKQEAVTITKELMRMQEIGFPIQGEMFVPRRPNAALLRFIMNETTEADIALMRERGLDPSKLETWEAAGFLMRARTANTATAQELMADGLAVYFLNPQYLKQNAPSFHTWASEILNTSDSNQGVVEFYSLPIMGIVAGIMAMIAQGGAEDEEEKGALALGQGALSA